MKPFFLFLLALWSVTPIFAQECDYSIRGEVIDFHDKTPLSEALVSITGTDRYVTTDTNGTFRIGMLCPGPLELEISHAECTSKFVFVPADQKKPLKLSLEHHLEELEEVQVTGDTQRKQTASSIEKTVRTETMDRMAGSNLGDVLKQLSGVASLNTGANIVKPVVQGLTGSRILILNNGVRMQDMEWGDEHAPNIDINAADRLTLIKGAGALQYGGDAIGGVIMVAPERIFAKDSLYGTFLASGATNGRGGTTSLELIKSFDNGLFFKVQGSYKRLGDLEAPDYLLSNTGVSQIGTSLQIGKNAFREGWELFYSYFDSDIAILRASHIGNVDDLITAINSRQPNVIDPFSYTIDNPRQEVSHHLVKGKYYRRFEGLGKLTLQYDFQSNQRFEYDLRRGDRRNIPAIDLKLNTHTFNADFKADANSQWESRFGIMGRYQQNIADPSTGVRRLIPDYEKYDMGLFGTTSYTLSDALVLDAGFRYDFTRIDAKKFYRLSRWEAQGYNSDFEDIIIEDLGSQLLTNPVLDYHNFSGTLGAGYQLGNENELRVNYAFSQRAPNPSELFSEGLHHSAARIELGDLRIKSETSHKLGISLEKSVADWGYTLVPYINQINDFILIEPTGAEFTIRGAFPVWSYRQTDVVMAGVDASVYRQWLPKWRSEHQFSFIKGRDETLDGPIINMPPVQIQNRLVYRNPEWQYLRVALDSKYVFRQNEFPSYVNVFSPQSNENVVLDINTPPPAYHLLNLDMETRFDLFKKKDLTVGLSILNVMNTNYRDYLNRLRFFADDLGRNWALRLIWSI
ncbi:TonB-dependent receptor [Maribacter sp. 2-571]|uniref:TonB-dependent receptor n=1 Tax=Maribacter sp. 2-571 TaxID=3417569 RepID=UPI003D33700D